MVRTTSKLWVLFYGVKNIWLHRKEMVIVSRVLWHGSLVYIWHFQKRGFRMVERLMVRDRSMVCINLKWAV